MGPEGGCHLWRQPFAGRDLLGHHVYAEFIPIAAVVVDEVIDFVESLECDGMCESGVWGAGMEAFPVVTFVSDKVGDLAEDLIWYNGAWGGHGVMHMRRRGK